MKTTLIQSPRQAAKLIRSGGLVAFPTETVFGLGVDATNDQAVEKLFTAKGRPSSNPLIVHIAQASDWAVAADMLTPTAEALLAEFAPGPLTVVLPKRPEISSLVTAGLQTVGIRVPDHPVAREILQLAGIPVAAPSANRSGKPSGTRWRTVLDDLEGRIEAVFEEDGPSLGLESTVVDCTSEVATVLRPGAVTLEQIRQVMPDAQLISDVADNARDDNLVRSPGTLHPHYQPQARVLLVKSPDSLELTSAERIAYCGLQAPSQPESLALCSVYESLEEYASDFYEFLREADRQQVATIYIECAPDQGIGHALRDRQFRAAGQA